VWNPLDDLICDRMEQLRDDWRVANGGIVRHSDGRRSGLSEAICRWRTRLGAAVVALGRWIVPADARAAIPGPAGRLDHC
jgi:hypothetical protein